MTLRDELAQAIHSENFDVTDSGLYFPRQGVMASGEYFDRINSGEWKKASTLL